LVRVRLHVKREGDGLLDSKENYELTRVPLLGELLSIEGGALYVVTMVFHTPDRHDYGGDPSSGYHGEVWVREQTKEEHETMLRSASA
jgi:hypothetical protein